MAQEGKAEERGIFLYQIRQRFATVVEAVKTRSELKAARSLLLLMQSSNRSLSRHHD